MQIYRNTIWLTPFELSGGRSREVGERTHEGWWSDYPQSLLVSNRLQQRQQVQKTNTKTEIQKYRNTKYKKYTNTKNLKIQKNTNIQKIFLKKYKEYKTKTRNTKTTEKSKCFIQFQIIIIFTGCCWFWAILPNKKGKLGLGHARHLE